MSLFFPCILLAIENQKVDRHMTARLSGMAIIQKTPKLSAITSFCLAAKKLKKEDQNIVLTVSVTV